MTNLHDANRWIFFTLRLVSFCVFGLTSFKIAAEVNIVPDGKTVVLLSSKKRAKLDPLAEPVELAKEKAENLCKILNMDLKELKLTQSDSLLDTDKDKPVYKAELPILTSEGLVFQSGVFPLIKYPSSPSKVSDLETILYAGSGIVGTGGGLTSFGTYLGIDGPGDPETALLIGGITLGVAGVCALLGAGCTLIRKARGMSKNIDNENPVQYSKIFAEPILATAIFCQ